MISTKNINTNGSSLSKVLEPGNKTIKINSVALEKGYKDDTYNIVMQCEGIALENFEGFYKDVKDQSLGRYEGQVGRVKSSEWPYNDFILPNGNKIVRDHNLNNHFYSYTLYHINMYKEIYFQKEHQY